MYPDFWFPNLSIIPVCYCSQVQCCVSEDVSQVINKNIAMLEGRFGVLLFLYSILLTKVQLQLMFKRFFTV